MNDLLLQPAIKVVKEEAFSTSVNAIEIKLALLSYDSGVLAAAVLALGRHNIGIQLVGGDSLCLPYTAV